MFSILGYHATPVTVDGERSVAAFHAAARHRAVPVLVARWADDLGRLWRRAMQDGLIDAGSWTYCWNAREIRLLHAARPWDRRYIGFDLARCAVDHESFGLLWAVMRADALDPPLSTRTHRAARRPVRRDVEGGTRARLPQTQDAPCLVDEIVTAAGVADDAICRGLEEGVHTALVWLADALARSGPRRLVPPADGLLEQALTVVYRLLFLLFAEARALVPMWHRVYRESYSVEALREAVERGAASAGLWPAVQAMARLAHSGCHVGTLRVTPFNGHLFEPQAAPLAERATISDASVAHVLQALTTTTRPRDRRVRISFADLGVEQLGAIYERVLGHRLVVGTVAAPAGATPASPHPGVPRPEAAAAPRARLVASRQDRKATATFYTPRSLADLIVRRTLAPLLDGTGSAGILRLRIVDPAMGSGAFLVAACQHLARAYEAAVVREQQLRDHEIGERERADFRRLVARHCLYGVDRDPMAVHLARLSLWLATLARDVPLTFLDHHLRVGDSLVGAGVGDLLRQAPRHARGQGRRDHTLPLFTADEALAAADAVMPARRQLADLPDDSLARVRQKERLLSELDARGAPLDRWRRAADVWCAPWFWTAAGPVPTGPVWQEILAAALNRTTSLSGATIEALLDGVRTTASRRRFFHWQFEFPEVFWRDDDSCAANGVLTAGGGFDAVIGNPPWDMLRRHGQASDAADGAAQLARFVREAGVYMGTGEAHVNLYLLFVERALQVLRHGGRLGMVVPWGLAGDQGAARVRRVLLESCAIDTCLTVDNRRGLFPIHRGLRFLVATGTRGSPTRALPLAHIRGEPSAIDACPESAAVRADHLTLARGLLERLSPASLAVPFLRSRDELHVLEQVWRLAPALGSTEGWGVSFGRELNATDDRGLLHSRPPGLPVLEGKHVDPFCAHVRRASRFVTREAAARKLPGEPFARSRLAYRDVASATNARTLIAAIVPAGVVTTHTLFCCRTPLDDDAQHALCALLNSLVANWIVRRWVSTHVTVGLMERVPVPAPAQLGASLEALAEEARRLTSCSSPARRLAHEGRVHAWAARAWGVDRGKLEVLLTDFPQLEGELRRAVLREFDRGGP
jgi:hypothetical protein